MELRGFLSEAALSMSTSGELQVPRSPAFRARDGEAGQIVVLFALALIFAITAMVALVLEGGNAFAQQRIAQNAVDSVANSGTLVIAEKLSGAAKTGDDVYNAVAAAATANNLANPAAIYTDNVGDPLSPTVAVAPGVALPANARGVQASGDRVAGTTFGRLLGVNQITASAQATAIAGAASGGCPDDTACGLLPVTFPVSTSICDGSGRLTGIGGTGDLWKIVTPPLTADNESIVPLCKTAPGAVGWLDLNPSENLAGEISNPISDFAYPSWVQTQPGNPNSVENLINTLYSGKIILIPMFDGTCRIKPATGSTPCPDADKGVDPVGNNTYYHIPYLAALRLDVAIIQGANVNDCNNHNSAAKPQLISTTPEFLGCLTGWFVDYVLPGEVDPFTTITPETVIAMQLIK